METRRMINIVGSQCKPEVEKKFNTWYSQTHIPMLMKFKGLKKVTRCKLLKPVAGSPQYLVIYEFENQEAFEKYETSPERTAALDEMRGTWKDGGYEMTWRAPYEIIEIQQKDT